MASAAPCTRDTASAHAASRGAPISARHPGRNGHHRASQGSSHGQDTTGHGIASSHS
ncbi:hypothetical protein ACQPW3_01965 [Actinosynnema sp. CA-248983]